MKIKTLKNMGFDGKHTPAGTIVQCPQSLAKELISTNRAVAVTDDHHAKVETKTEGPAPFPGDGTDGDNDLDDADDKPSKPGKPN